MCEGSCGIETRMFHFTGVGVWVPRGSLWGELLGAVVTVLCKSSLGLAAVDTKVFNVSAQSLSTEYAFHMSLVEIIFLKQILYD